MSGLQSIRARWTAPDVGALFVVSGPSGSGKTTLLHAALEAVPGLEFSVSATTRAPRAGERDGVDYHFVTRAAFERLLEEGALLEHAEVYGNFYGTPGPRWRPRSPRAAASCSTSTCRAPRRCVPRTRRR